MYADILPNTQKHYLLNSRIKKIKKNFLIINKEIWSAVELTQISK